MVKLPPVITIDGLSGTGKSTLSKSLSKYLNWYHLESGMMYRILACLFIDKNSDLSKENLISILKELDNYLVFKNGIICQIIKKNFSDQYIISKKVTEYASKLSTISYIRSNLLIKQRLFRRHPGLIANGRDMGTVVFPDAQVKFFLTAKLENRVSRRMIELKKNEIHVDFKTLMRQMFERDARDTNRIIAPLKPHKKSIVIDTTSINSIEVFNIAINYIKKINII